MEKIIERTIDTSKWLANLAAAIVGWLAINFRSVESIRKGDIALASFSFSTMLVLLLSIYLRFLFCLEPKAGRKIFNYDIFNVQVVLLVAGGLLVLLGPFWNAKISKEWGKQISVKVQVPKIEEIKFNQDDIKSLQKLSFNIEDGEIKKLKDATNLKIDAPEKIKLEGINIPNTIRIDSCAIPTKIKIEDPNVPKTIMIQGNKIPSEINISGTKIPNTITVQGKEYLGKVQNISDQVKKIPPLLNTINTSLQELQPNKYTRAQ